MARAFELSDAFGFVLPGDVALHPDGSAVAFTLRTADREKDAWVQRVHVVGTSEHDGEPVLVGDGPGGSPKWSPCGTWLAHSVKGSAPLRLWSPIDGRTRSLLEGFRGVGNLTWSPDGGRIAFVAPDPGGLAPDALAPRVVREMVYKVDGAGLVPPARRHLFIVEVATAETRRLTDIASDVQALSWSPDGSRIAFAAALHAGREFDRVTNAFELDVASAELRQLTDWNGTVTWTAWDEAGTSLFLAGQHLPGPNRNATLFRLFPGSGKPLDLLPGFDRRVVVPSGNGPGAVVFLADGRLMFCARDRGRTLPYTVDPDGGVPEPVLDGESTVVTGLSCTRDGSAVALSISDGDSAGDLWLFDPANGTMERLTRFEQPRGTVSHARDVTFTGPGGELHGYLMVGANNSHGCPPPLLVDIHGGPDNAWRPNLSPFYLYRQVLCARGWNVLLLNPRGSDGYGEEYMRSAMLRLGHSEEEDFLAAIDQLVDRGLANPRRLAVMGVSHGGFMANWLTARTTRFAAAVSTGCIANWVSLYGTSSTAAGFVIDQMGGTPQEVPQRYSASTPLTYARSVTAPTLLVHGEDDMLNPVGQSEEWYTTLRRQGCEVEFVRYPTASHLFMYVGHLTHQLDYTRRAVEWLVRHVEGR
ncbi:S9 family peptidase [Lentzea flaviverrucosa]|uniref:Acyl-peptide hydrolase n=1 Tax=Lentzea flaviverrucosa TaxID=200379 RepID=A0A1H9WV62_9PSEU|nr:S9 family peptidase [Lentzea flaviverrucosa]RDI23095.1 dipeptidyl aminopeptidase/acylaminoacyl peptidase [Lentzea flaviverrucosa]SES37303.1 Dipeptidyl aminopeptidase/acylaminoacyl peptidase [Lentzea flaviverrucosa]